MSGDLTSCLAVHWYVLPSDAAPGPGTYLSLPTPGTKEVLSPRPTAPAFGFGKSRRFIVKAVRLGGGVAGV